ncbi:MAG: sugar transferase [Gammaproteobacteria bacterium]|nr:sugar transferase [Gammaproteobacteria bacterium]
MKRLLDIVVSFTGLVLLAPLLIVVMLLVWRQDWSSPLYIAPRVGRGGQLFNMIKLRSMVISADKSGVESTSSSDQRITPLGHFIRRYKLDELGQLWNVLVGEMSLVGPRPNTRAGTNVYTVEEQKLLSIKPGITDFASIVFSDEGEILRDQVNPDQTYDQLIRPWKSRLGLLYVENNSLLLDVQLIIYSVIAVASKNYALNQVVKRLRELGAEEDIVAVAQRKSALQPTSPPGASDIST